MSGKKVGIRRRQRPIPPVGQAVPDILAHSFSRYLSGIA